MPPCGAFRHAGSHRVLSNHDFGEILHNPDGGAASFVHKDIMGSHAKSTCTPKPASRPFGIACVGGLTYSSELVLLEGVCVWHVELYAWAYSATVRGNFYHAKNKSVIIESRIC